MASHYQPIRIKSPSGHFLFLRSRYDPISGSFQQEHLLLSSPHSPPETPVGSACRTLIPLSVSGQRIRPLSALSQRRASGRPVTGQHRDVSADLQGSLTVQMSNSKKRGAPRLYTNGCKDQHSYMLATRQRRWN